MKEERVSFETAKKAKEKGFDLMCENYFMGSGRLFSGSIKLDYNKLEFTKEKYSAPTQSLLQKWLRDKHDIHIHLTTADSANGTIHNAMVIRYGERTEYKVIPFSEKMEKEITDATFPMPFKTYELALEAALNQALDMIGKTN